MTIFVYVAVLLSLTPNVAVVYRDGSVEVLAPASALTSGELARVDRGWTWSATSAPRLVAPSTLSRVELVPPDGVFLTAQVTCSQPAHPSGLQGSRVVAAPVQMWRDLPEPHLPFWATPPCGDAAIPVDGKSPWRLRLLAGESGSWWTDIDASQRHVHLVPEVAIERAIQVTDDESRGLAGARIQLFGFDANRQRPPRQIARYVGDERGGLLIASLPSGPSVNLMASVDGYAPGMRTGELGERSTVQLRAGVRLHGRFVDQEGQPVGTVVVRAEAWLSSSMLAWTPFTTDSDARGEWEIRGVPEGTVALLAAARDRVPYRAQLDAVGEAVDVGDVILNKGRSLLVRVVDDQGAPVGGARISAESGQDGVADAEGHFSLAGLSNGEERIRVEAPEHLSAEVRAPPDEESITAVLDRAFVVHGRLVDAAAGTSVPNARVRIREGTTYRDVELSAQGRFQLDLEPETPVELRFSAPGIQPVRLPVRTGLSGEHLDLGDVSAVRGITVTGEVFSRKTGEAIVGARVWTPRRTAQGPLLAWLDGDLLTANTDPDGRFELRGLSAGPTQLRFDHYAHAELRVDVQLDPEPDSFDLGRVDLSRGVSVEVQFEDVPAGAVARLDLTNRWLESDMLTAAVLPESLTAMFRHVPEGSHTLSVISERDVLCERSVEVSRADIAVFCKASSMRVRGTVEVAERAVGPGTLVWSSPSLGAAGSILRVVTDGGLQRDHVAGAGRPSVPVAVAGDGFFSSEKLRPGSWQVIWYPESGGSSEPRTVALPNTRDFETVLSFPGAVLHGGVQTTDGETVHGARVRELSRGVLAFTSADGSFTVMTEAGQRFLQARHGDLLSRIVEIDVQNDVPSEQVTLILGEDEEQRDEVEITVRDGQGRAISGAFVFLETDRGDLRLLTADFSGTARAPLRPPRPNRIRLAAFGSGRWIFGSWLEWGEGRQAVLLEATPTGAALVSTPSRHGYAQVVTADGWDLSSLLTRIGTRPSISPSSPLRLHGLPIGTYQILVEGEAVRFSTRVEETVEVTVE